MRVRSASLSEHAASLDLAGAHENRVLYQMCLDHPKHDDAAVTAGKLISIGRIYSASPDRGIKTTSIGRNDFFEFLADGEGVRGLDTELARLSDDAVFGEQGVRDLAVKIHGYLVSEISNRTQEWLRNSLKKDERSKTPSQHRSFASKYLHFHRPNVFPILDSVAAAALRAYASKGAGEDYGLFCKAIEAFIEKTGCENSHTLRQIDQVLLSHVFEMRRKN